MKQAGFTLIELIVALVLVVILSVIATTGLHQLIKIDGRLRDINDSLSELNIAVWRFENDITQLQMRHVLDEAGAPEPFISLQADDLSFTTATMLPPGDNTGMVDFMRVDYRLEGKKLVRITYGVVDRVVNTKTFQEVLLNNVANVTWTFMDSQHEWQSSWGTSNTLANRPIAVDMKITFIDGKQIEREILLTAPYLAKRVENVQGS
jgi:general secretion pathway protein J